MTPKPLIQPLGERKPAPHPQLSVTRSSLVTATSLLVKTFKTYAEMHKNNLIQSTIIV